MATPVPASLMDLADPGHYVARLMELLLALLSLLSAATGAFATAPSADAGAPQAAVHTAALAEAATEVVAVATTGARPLVVRRIASVPEPAPFPALRPISVEETDRLKE